ncbi:MAG: lysine--tRNA ligase [Candidatus Parvarchaeota archaeon]|nr:lysine--tRNA ligase [Candidatus Marsarchaeota archaeon]MCL5101189.1 lysine--tRNA ligase [Candidatus Parvarchaeota archaeon]
MPESRWTKAEMREKHWSDILAERVMERKKDNYIITGGITTSGKPHLGTVGEVLYSSTIKEVIEEAGRKATFYFIADILDAFDSIPVDIEKYKGELAPQLGKPLAHVTDPFKCHVSYGEHYLQELMRLVDAMELNPVLVRSSELYEQGHFDSYTKRYLEEEDTVKEIVARSSLKEVSSMKDWSVIMPICEKCGKIATTRVLSHTDTEYEYSCDRDVGYIKGCGYIGNASIYDHRYKLQWRVHWPTWQAYFNSDVEGSGVDHMTRGGSGDTAIAIHKEFLKRDPPILYKYGFVMFHGKKYSKSKGIGIGAEELFSLVPPQLTKYLLSVTDLDKDKDIDPTGDRLIKVYEEVERLSKLSAPENRADEKKFITYRRTVGALRWKAHFLDILLNYQIYKDWDRVGDILGDREGILYLAPFITKWLKEEYEPERYNFAVKQGKITKLGDVVAYFAASLKEGMNDLEVHNLVYSVSKEKNVAPSELFKQLYLAIISKEDGPRLGKLVTSIGIDRVKEMLDKAA